MACASRSSKETMPQQRPPQIWTLILLLLVLALLAYLSTQRSPRPSRARQSVPGRPTRQALQDCRTLGIGCASTYFAQWQPPALRSCRTRETNGDLLPDPRCTPGGIDPSVTLRTLRDRAFSTRCDRDCASSHNQKIATYGWYGIRKPQPNSGPEQVCELDHLVPLELGGADGLGNLWPECGPDGVALDERQFKRKDAVENYLADEVRAGRIPLAQAQRGIAEDWTQYLSAARASR